MGLKFKSKRFIASLLVLVMFLTMIPVQAFAETTQGSLWDGMSDLHLPLTRAEACKIIAEDLGLVYNGETSSFLDVDASHPYYEVISLIYGRGLMAGDPNGNFLPDENIKRSEYATVLFRGLGYDENLITPMDIIDVPTEYWASKYISGLLEKSHMFLYSDGTFKPEDLMTRQAALDPTSVQRMGFQSEIRAVVGTVDVTNPAVATLDQTNGAIIINDFDIVGSTTEGFSLVWGGGAYTYPLVTPITVGYEDINIGFEFVNNSATGVHISFSNELNLGTTTSSSLLIPLVQIGQNDSGEVFVHKINGGGPLALSLVWFNGTEVLSTEIGVYDDSKVIKSTGFSGKVVDENGQPIEGAWVRGTHLESGKQTAGFLTDSQGQFWVDSLWNDFGEGITDLPLGTYTVRVWKEGHPVSFYNSSLGYVLTEEDASTIQLSREINREDTLSLVMPAGGQVTGSVGDVTGLALEGIEVHFVRSEGPYYYNYVFSETGGTFSNLYLPQGTYKVIAVPLEGSGLVPKLYENTLQITSTNNIINNIDVILEQPAPVWDGASSLEENITLGEAVRHLLTTYDPEPYAGEQVDLLNVPPSHEYYEDFAMMINRGYLLGANQYVDYNRNVTRAEYATMLLRVLKLSQNTTGNTPIQDVSSDHWSYGYVSKVVDEKQMYLYSDGTFKPEALMTRKMAVYPDSVYLQDQDLNTLIGLELVEGQEVVEELNDSSGYLLVRDNFTLGQLKAAIKPKYDNSILSVGHYINEVFSELDDNTIVASDQKIHVTIDDGVSSTSHEYDIYIVSENSVELLTVENQSAVHSIDNSFTELIIEPGITAGELRAALQSSNSLAQIRVSTMTADPFTESPVTDTTVVTEDMWVAVEVPIKIQFFQIKFRPLRAEASLSEISVNGVPVVGFDPSTLNYAVELPYGTTAIPTVGAITADSKAKVQVTNSTTTTGTAAIIVTAENGVATKTYNVSFSVAPDRSKFNLVSKPRINADAQDIIFEIRAARDVHGSILPDGVYDVQVNQATYSIPLTLGHGTIILPEVPEVGQYEYTVKVAGVTAAQVAKFAVVPVKRVDLATNADGSKQAPVGTVTEETAVNTVFSDGVIELPINVVIPPLADTYLKVSDVQKTDARVEVKLQVGNLGDKTVTLSLPIPSSLADPLKTVGAFHQNKNTGTWEHRAAAVIGGEIQFTTNLSAVAVAEAIEVPVITGATATGNKLEISWNRPASYPNDATVTYELIRVQGINETVVTSSGFAATTFEDTVSYGTTYQYKVRATVNNYQSAWSETVEVITGVDPNRYTGSSGGSTTVPQGIISKSQGGTVASHGATIIVPANAVNSDIKITVTKLSEVSALPLESRAKIVGEVFEITKDKAGNFEKNIEITLPFDKTKVDSSKYDIAIFWLNEQTNKWIKLDNVKVDLVNAKVSGEVNHFTKFAVLAVEKINVSLSDIKGHWAEEQIKELVALGAITGYKDGSFKPKANITRAEFATVLVKALGLEAKPGRIFKDTANHWAKEYIVTADAYGIVNGYDGENFGANEFITREQMAVMIVRAAKLAQATNSKAFADADKISTWAKDSVAIAASQEVITGYQDNTFKPKGTATRAEAVMVISKILNK